MAALGKLDYSVDTAKITSSTGEVLEMKDLISAIDIYESLLSPYIKCEMTIVDSANFLETVPIIGQEKLEIQITEGKNKIKRTFYVGAVSNYVKGNATTSMYTLKLISPEQMMNSLTLVSHAYSGPISESINFIAKDYLKTNIKTLEKTSGNYRVIIPNWKPFQSIEWLARRAINAKQTPYAFYETLLGGFNFESYETMFKKTTYNKFVHKGATSATSDAENQAASFNVAFEYDLKEYSTTYKNILRGTFGSGLHSVDIGSREYKFIKYNYDDDFKKKQHLDKISFLNSDFKVNNKKISDYDSYHHLINKNSKAFGKEAINNYNNEVEFTKLETDPFVYQLSLNKINLAVRGRTDLSVGKIIEFEVDKNKPFVYGNTKEANQYLTGKYLVLNTHHKMANGKYVVLLDVVRDSLGKKVKKR